MLKNILTNWIFNGIAGIASIVGFILSIILLNSANRIYKRMNDRIKNIDEIKKFNKIRKDKAIELLSCQKLVCKDDILDLQLISQITNVINDFENLDSILTKKDKKYINRIRKELKKEADKINKKDKQKICNEISYFISRYEKEEEVPIWEKM